MKKSGRYDTSGMIEDQYEEGSKGLVLKNIIGIKTSREMGQLETKELVRCTDELLKYYERNHRFTAADICYMHKLWLGPIYEWAGRYRQVKLSKAGLPFANPEFIPQLMEEFEKNILASGTPCIFQSRNKTGEAIAIVHVELLLIHPFREGNGRLARLLAILMALQAGLPLLDFTDIEGQKREEYFSAVRDGLNRNYEPMKRVFSDVVLKTLKIYGEK